MKKFLFALGLSVAVSNSAYAGECDSAKDIADKVDKVLGKLCVIAAAKIDCTKVNSAKDKIADAVKQWNEVFKDSKSQIGPRTIDVGTIESGELLAGTMRTFLSPMALDGKFEITVTKKDGKAADVTLCVIDGTGRAAKVGSFDFNKDDKGAKSKTVELEGKVLVVKLDAEKMNKFGYDVKITQKK